MPSGESLDALVLQLVRAGGPKLEGSKGTPSVKIQYCEELNIVVVHLMVP